MKADFYVVIMGRYLFWIWLGLGGYCSVFAKPKKRLCDLPSDGTAGFASVNKQPRRLGKGDFGSDRDLNH